MNSTDVIIAAKRYLDGVNINNFLICGVVWFNLSISTMIASLFGLYAGWLYIASVFCIGMISIKPTKEKKPVMKFGVKHE